MEQDFNKIFKAPKYTGVSLSLLSMFVLVCMIVVWQKMPIDDGIQTQDFEVWAESSLALPINSVVIGYQDELNSSAEVKYYSRPHLIQKLDETKIEIPDLVIITVDNESTDRLTLKKFKEKIPLAFHPKLVKKQNSLAGKLISAFVPKQSPKAAEGLRFARFIAAPNRGQFYFAQNNLIGVDGDHWKSRPEISFLCDSKFQDMAGSLFDKANQRENSIGRFDFKIQSELQTTIDILSASKAIKYFPDLVLTSIELKHSTDYFKLVEKITNKFYLYVFEKGPHDQLCKRLASNIAHESLNPEF